MYSFTRLRVYENISKSIFIFVNPVKLLYNLPPSSLIFKHNSHISHMPHFFVGSPSLFSSFYPFSSLAYISPPFIYPSCPSCPSCPSPNEITMFCMKRFLLKELIDCWIFVINFGKKSSLFNNLKNILCKGSACLDNLQACIRILLQDFLFIVIR